MTTIGFLLDPKVYLPDLLGVYAAFSGLPEAEFRFYWKDTRPSQGFPRRFPSQPTHRFDQLDAPLDVLCTGAGDAGCLTDPEVLEFLRRAGGQARVLVGICAGVLPLAAAGLLQGYRATASFPALAMLSRFPGVEVAPPGPCVVDRNRITAGPVHGSIEAGLRALELLHGREEAELAGALMEYGPEPSPALRARAQQRLELLLAGWGA